MSDLSIAVEPEVAAEPEIAAEPEVEESAGHQAVDAAVRSVHNAAGLSAQEQLAAYEAAHRTLREVLSSIEE